MTDADGDELLRLHRKKCDKVITPEEEARLQDLTSQGEIDMGAKRERSQEYKDKQNARKKAARAAKSKPAASGEAKLPRVKRPVRSKPARVKANEPSTNGNGKPHSSNRPSLVNAAAKVLGEQGAPLTVSELYSLIVSGGHWQTTAGKTPERTLAARIGTEINTAGKSSRFKRADRGKFELVKSEA